MAIWLLEAAGSELVDLQFEMEQAIDRVGARPNAAIIKQVPVPGGRKKKEEVASFFDYLHPPIPPATVESDFLKVRQLGLSGRSLANRTSVDPYKRMMSVTLTQFAKNDVHLPMAAVVEYHYVNAYRAALVKQGGGTSVLRQDLGNILRWFGAVEDDKGTHPKFVFWDGFRPPKKGLGDSLMTDEERQRSSAVAIIRKSAQEVNQKIINLIEKSPYSHVRFEKSGLVSNRVAKAVTQLIEACLLFIC